MTMAFCTCCILRDDSQMPVVAEYDVDVAVDAAAKTENLVLHI